MCIRDRFPGNVQLRRGLCAYADKACGFFHGLEKINAVDSIRCDDRSKDIPCPRTGFPGDVHTAAAVTIAVEAVAARAVAAIRKLFRFLFYGNEIHKIIAVLHACYHDFVRPHGVELLRKLLQLFGSPSGFPVCSAGEKAGLRDVGGDDVCHGEQLFHFFTMLRSDGTVSPAVIAHHRIQDNDRPVPVGRYLGMSGISGLKGQKVLNNADLCHTSQKAAVDTVEGQFQFPPFFQVFRQNIQMCIRDRMKAG